VHHHSYARVPHSSSSLAVQKAASGGRGLARKLTLRTSWCVGFVSIHGSLRCAAFLGAKRFERILRASFWLPLAERGAGAAFTRDMSAGVTAGVAAMTMHVLPSQVWCYGNPTPVANQK